MSLVEPSLPTPVPAAAAVEHEEESVSEIMTRLIDSIATRSATNIQTESSATASTTTSVSSSSLSTTAAPTPPAEIVYANPSNSSCSHEADICPDDAHEHDPPSVGLVLCVVGGLLVFVLGGIAACFETKGERAEREAKESTESWRRPPSAD